MVAPLKKSYDQPRQQIKKQKIKKEKSRSIALPTKVCLAKSMVFPVVMYVCKSWTIKKAGPWRIDAFELCVGEDS